MLNSFLHLPPNFAVYTAGLQLWGGKMWRIHYLRSQAPLRVFLVSLVSVLSKYPRIKVYCSVMT